MTSLLKKTIDSTSGSAAVEMALVTPILLTLMFGSFELGNYFLDDHVVIKAVRDGARYAARLPISNYSCPSGSTSGTLLGSSTAIKNVTRTGTPDGTGAPRLASWTSQSTITITVGCKPTATYPGMYSQLPGDVPVVTISASVPYTTLFSRLGWQIKQSGAGTTMLNLNAQSQAAVMGI